MFVPILYKAVNLQGPFIVTLKNIVLVPSKFWNVFDGLTDVTQTLSLGLRSIIKALDCLHIKLSH